MVQERDQTKDQGMFQERGHIEDQGKVLQKWQEKDRREGHERDLWIEAEGDPKTQRPKGNPEKGLQGDPLIGFQGDLLIGLPEDL